jgi:hypothetical protein
MSSDLKLLNNAERIIGPRCVRKRTALPRLDFDPAVQQLRLKDDDSIGAGSAADRYAAVNRRGENEALIIVGVVAE